MRIYKFYRLRWTNAWRQLSTDKQQATLARVDAIRDQVGGHVIVGCDSAWATERWQIFGIEEYPNMDAVVQHQRMLQDMNWFHYIESESMLGTCLGSSMKNALFREESTV